ncbi:hypothetical protein ALC56_13896 [Trachymyrmex septentrionalis]|uniref:Transmembrane protein n=1 Tax=Trachymyrmex septentrionalis TaxID=34720 RepID=A0A195EV38_9HYME|nr:hypothetical protein ALC56_13896 [Trachymyrmex septentrionalis]
MHPCGTQGRDKRRSSPLEGFHGSREKDHSTELRIISERVVVEGERSRDEKEERRPIRVEVRARRHGARSEGDDLSLSVSLFFSLFSVVCALAPQSWFSPTVLLALILFIFPRSCSSTMWFDDLRSRRSFLRLLPYSAGLVTGRDASRNSSTKSCIANRLLPFWNIGYRDSGRFFAAVYCRSRNFPIGRFYVTILNFIFYIHIGYIIVNV